MEDNNKPEEIIIDAAVDEQNSVVMLNLDQLNLTEDVAYKVNIYALVPDNQNSGEFIESRELHEKVK